MLVPVPADPDDDEVGGQNWGNMNPEVVPARGKADVWTTEKGTMQKASVLGRTWVAMARDEGVYQLEGYKKKMAEVRDIEVRLNRLWPMVYHRET